jgi:hypothetical protein
MKTQHLTSLIAIGALLPLTALGQSNREAERERQERMRNTQPSGETQTPSGAGVIDRRPGHNSPHYAPGSDTSRDVPGMSDDAQYRQQQRQQQLDRQQQQQYGDQQRQHGQQHHQLGASGQIQRISSDEIDQRLTASSIIGKKIVDREGQDVGRIRDIGLGGVVPQLSQQGAQTAAQRSEIGQRNQAQTRAGTQAQTPGAQGSVQAGQNEWSASAGGPEPRVFVQPDRALGVRGDLVAIPAGQLRRDGDNFRIEMSRDQLRNLITESDRVTQTR